MKKRSRACAAHWASWLGVAALAACTTLATVHPATDGIAHGLPLPAANSGVTTVSVARDGSLWFTESTGNRIGHMRADGSGYQGFALPHPNSSPRIIAFGGDGNIWFSEHTGNRIGRLTPAGMLTEFDIPTPASQPRAIALGADGNIWFGEFAGGKVGRITQQGVITEFALPTPDSGPRALAAGPDGNIWVSEFRAGKLARITPRGAITEFTLPRPNSGPGDITAGVDGAMWFVELSGSMDGLQPDGGRVARITMNGVVTEYELPSKTPSAVNIAIGPDRNAWYTRGALVGARDCGWKDHRVSTRRGHAWRGPFRRQRSPAADAAGGSPLCRRWRRQSHRLVRVQATSKLGGAAG
ncbi:MAG: hypothetical protein WDO12_11600 [Pseudomonadota bacterium]